MKKLSNLVLILGVLFFVGSMTSCTVGRGAGKHKKKRKKNCNCPRWSDVQQPISNDEVIAWEACL